MPGTPPLLPAIPFAAVEILPRRSVFLRYQKNVTMEISGDRIDLVALKIEPIAADSEAGPCPALPRHR